MSLVRPSEACLRRVVLEQPLLQPPPIKRRFSVLVPQLADVDEGFLCALGAILGD